MPQDERKRGNVTRTSNNAPMRLMSVSAIFETAAGNGENGRRSPTGKKKENRTVDS